MKTNLSLSLLLCAAVIGGAGCVATDYQAGISAAVAVPGPHPLGAATQTFYSNLSPYGQWTWLDRYGWVWSPNDVPYGWRPYTAGNWVWTDYGWTWNSDYPWGWACFHYGRWLYNEDYGWLWMPGTVWGPAWVAWNYGDQWCGWAPLPPFVEWESEPDWDTIIAPHCWVFVDRDDFVRRHLGEHCLPEARNVTLLHETRNITRIRRENGHIFNRGVAVADIEKATGRHVPRYRIHEFRSPEEAHHFHGSRDEIAAVRPSFKHEQQAPEHRAPAEARPPTEVRPEAPGRAQRRAEQSQERAQRELQHRQARERQSFYRYQAQQRSELQSQHERELARPPRGTTYPQLFQRHMAENRALERQMNRENRVFERRQEREFHQSFHARRQQPNRTLAGQEHGTERGRSSGRQR